MIGGVGRGLVKLDVLRLRCHYGCGFVFEVGHQHRSSLWIKHTITACLYLFQRRCIQANGGLRWSGLWRGLFCARASLDLADEGYSSIFCVYGAIVSEEQVSSHKSTSAFCAFERSLFGICAKEVELAKGKEAPHDPTNPSINQSGSKVRNNLRDLSCLLRCSLRLNARAQ